MKSTSTIPVIAEARVLPEARRPELTADQIASVEREIAHFKTNANRTRYGEFRAKGYFIGSGVVEAGCKTVVGKRFKQSGMFWGQQGGVDFGVIRRG